MAKLYDFVKTDKKYNKYKTMLENGTPLGAVIQTMLKDGVIDKKTSFEDTNFGPSAEAMKARQAATQEQASSAASVDARPLQPLEMVEYLRLDTMEKAGKLTAVADKERFAKLDSRKKAAAKAAESSTGPDIKRDSQKTEAEVLAEKKKWQAEFDNPESRIKRLNEDIKEEEEMISKMTGTHKILNLPSSLINLIGLYEKLLKEKIGKDLDVATKKKIEARQAELKEAKQALAKMQQEEKAKMPKFKAGGAAIKSPTDQLGAKAKTLSLQKQLEELDLIIKEKREAAANEAKGVTMAGSEIARLSKEREKLVAALSQESLAAIEREAYQKKKAQEAALKGTPKPVSKELPKPAVKSAVSSIATQQSVKKPAELATVKPSVVVKAPVEAKAPAKPSDLDSALNKANAAAASLRAKLNKLETKEAPKSPAVTLQSAAKPAIVHRDLKAPSSVPAPEKSIKSTGGKVDSPFFAMEKAKQQQAADSKKQQVATVKAKELSDQPGRKGSSPAPGQNGSNNSGML